MKILLISVVTLIIVLMSACSGVDNHHHYKSLSRFTDPGDFSSMLEKLPDDVIGICEIAKQQTVHRNLLPYFKVPRSKWEGMNNVWPPKMDIVLRTLKETEPHNLYDNRKVENRLTGGCMNESHLLAGMLRYKNIPVRIRAGYFKDIRGNGPYITRFWENVVRTQGAADGLSDEELEEWKKSFYAFSKRQNEINHHLEHWICEYWDESKKKWRLLDANDTFLKASCDIEVGFHLPEKYFEYAYEAWKKMRKNKNFNPDQYAESQYDGPSHIRSQLLWDFFSLLNHDIPGCGQRSSDSYIFIKEKRYEKVSSRELEELDKLAALLSQEPTKDELVAFYRQCKTLRLEDAEKDPYSFVFKK